MKFVGNMKVWGGPKIIGVKGSRVFVGGFLILRRCNFRYQGLLRYQLSPYCWCFRNLIPNHRNWMFLKPVVNYGKSPTYLSCQLVSDRRISATQLVSDLRKQSMGRFALVYLHACGWSSMVNYIGPVQLIYNRPMDSYGLESFNCVTFCWGCLLLILGSEQFGYEQSSCPWEIAPQVKHQIFWLLSVGLFCLLLLLFETITPSCLVSKLSLDEPFFVGLYNGICWKSWLKSLNFFIFDHARVEED